jgi:aminoglycoside phosphotransferase (APT) family kinase protein
MDYLIGKKSKSRVRLLFNMEKKMKKYLPEVCSTLNELNNLVNISFLNEGYSDEQKYILTTSDGIKYLLRLSKPKDLKRKFDELEKMLQCFSLGVKCSEPIRYGLTSDKECFYSLLSWIKGSDGVKTIRELSKNDQFDVGVKSGKDLKLINSIKSDSSVVCWSDRFLSKHKLYYEIYKQSNIRFDEEAYVLHFIKENTELLEDRPSLFLHDDFHLSNIIIHSNKYAGTIDFNRCDYGDPWHEFVKMYMYSSELSIPFCHGQLNGYFGKALSNDFLTVSSVYLAATIISTLVWTKRIIPHEMNQSKKRIRRILEEFNNFKSNKPTWL